MFKFFATDCKYHFPSHLSCMSYTTLQSDQRWRFSWDTAALIPRSVTKSMDECTAGRACIRNLKCLSHIRQGTHAPVRWYAIRTSHLCPNLKLQRFQLPKTGSISLEILVVMGGQGSLKMIDTPLDISRMTLAIISIYPSKSITTYLVAFFWNVLTDSDSSSF